MLEWCKHSRKAHVQYQVYIQKMASCRVCLGISVLNREMIGVEVLSTRFLRPVNAGPRYVDSSNVQWTAAEKFLRSREGGCMIRGSV